MNHLVITHGFGRPGQVVVITAGFKPNQSGGTNGIGAHVLEASA